MRVLVLGGGVIGAAASFFLARAGALVTLVERHAPACAASGKAGGFLALDWCDGLARGALSRRGFALHAELARGPADGSGRRPVETLLIGREVGGGPRAGGAPGPGLGRGFAVRERLGGPETTALVDPARFTRKLVEAALALGARLVPAAVAGIEGGAGGWRARLAGGTLEADAVVLALGPWTGRIDGVGGLPPVGALLGHSLAFALDEPLPARALFVRLDPGRDGLAELEIYPRADGTVIVAGGSRPARAPADPAAVGPDPGLPERLAEAACAVLPGLRRARRVEARACLRPLGADGTPLIGPLPGRPGLWLATGHGPWGILEAPATGELLADLITGREAMVDPHPFDPARPSAGP